MAITKETLKKHHFWILVGITPLLVLIGGAPGTGKTTLGQRLSQTLGLPLISRDMIRHIVLDAFDVQTWEQGKAYSIAIYDIFFGIIASISASKYTSFS